MVIVVFAILSLLVPWPWTLVVLGVGVVGEVAEVIWGRRLARRLPATTGVEAMIGKRASVVDACRPAGRVRVRGELWNAVCPDGADAGDAVTVVAERDLVLQVMPRAQTRHGRSSHRKDVQVASRPGG